MGKRPSLIRQVEETLTAMLAPGRSKHQDKITGEDANYIYSYGTLATYLRQGCHFVRWAKEQYGCRYIEEARPHVAEYLTIRKDSVSANSVHTDAAAIAKLYKCQMRDFGVELPLRRRADITRSRLPRAYDREFSEANNKDVVDFCKACGPRQCELVALKPTEVAIDGTTVTILKGKGGKFRVVPVLPEYQAHVAKMRQQAIDKGQDRMFLREEIKNRMDEHSYRREYAQALYRYYESTEQYMSHTLYCCRGELAGVHFDRGIMKAVSRALGHERINVIAQSYLT
jgi:integrase